MNHEENLGYMTFSRKPILLIQGPGHAMERKTVGQAGQSVGGSKRGGRKGEPISDLAETIIKPPPPKCFVNNLTH